MKAMPWQCMFSLSLCIIRSNVFAVIIEIQANFCESDTAITGVPVLPLLALTTIGNARHIKPREHLLKGKAQYCLSPH